jgi:hypothetical protein
MGKLTGNKQCAITMSTFNVRGVMAATPIIGELLNLYQIDIMAVCEHWLFEDSLDFLNSIHPSYIAHSVSDNSLNPYLSTRRGKGGVAWLIHRKLIQTHTISPLPIEDDRIVGIKIIAQDFNIYAFCAYMPSSKEPIDIYREYCNKLSDIISQYSTLGYVMILGDLNAELKGTKCPHPKSPRSPILTKLVTNHQMSSVSVQACCHGPSYTYDPYETGLKRSLIDHILLDSNNIDLISDARVLPKGTTQCYNSSDHLPLICTLNIEPLMVALGVERIVRPRRNWHKNPQSKFDYKHALSRALDNVIVPKYWTTETSEEYYELLVQTIQSSAENSVPESKFSRRLMPRWTIELKHLHSDMMHKRRHWIKEGRVINSETHKHYKEGHRQFRRRFRQVAEEEDRSMFEEYDSTAEVDSRKLFRFVKKKNTKGIKIQEIWFGDTLLRHPRKICAGLADYYDKLYTPLEDPLFDKSHRKIIHKKFQEYMISSQENYEEILDDNLEINEVSEAVGELKTRKSGGPDNVTNEHLKYGGHTLVRHLHTLFCSMLLVEKTPSNMKKGLTISIPKDRTSKKQSVEKQRGITLLNVIYKLFERIMLNRFVRWKESRCLIFPDPLQSAYQRGRSCLHTSLNLQECINYNIDNGSKVYICFLDTSKAFDVVWHEGLFVKLYELGVKGKLWRIIVEAYTDMTTAVWHDGLMSRWIKVRQSVRQGGVLSTLLYLVFNNDVIKQLRDSGLGAKVGDIYCGSPVQADDLALIALTGSGLQGMMNICYKYSRLWRYLYNTSKTRILVRGESRRKKDSQTVRRRWHLGSQEVEATMEAKHVGVWICDRKGVQKCVSKGCEICRGMFMSLAGSGVRPKGLNPLTSCKLYKTIVLPRALYGCELWYELTSECINQLEKFQRLCCKICQNLAVRVRSDMVTTMLGLTTIAAHIDKAKLLFLGNTLRLDQSIVSNLIVTYKLSLYYADSSSVKSGFIPDIVSLITKYSLNAYMDQYMSSSIFPSKSTWKNIVDKVIMARENKLYSERALENNFNDFHMVMPTIFQSALWGAAREIPSTLSIFQFLVYCLVTAHLRDDILCEYCGELTENQVKHLATQCSVSYEQRELMWRHLRGALPHEQYLRLKELNKNELYLVMLGGFSNIPFELKWEEACTILHAAALLASSIRVWLSPSASVYTAQRSFKYKA